MGAPSQVNILVVDDRREELLAVEASLASLDQHLVLAHTGDEALRFLLREEAAVIVLDVQLPGLDGFEVARFLKQRRKTRRVPLIFLTSSYKEDRFSTEGYALGAVDYLTKPLDPEILRQKVSVFVDLALYEAELSAHLEEVAAQKRVIEEIIANAPAGIAFLSPKGHVVSANAIVLALLGKSADEVIDRPVADWLRGPFHRVLDSGQSLRLPDLVHGPPRQAGLPAEYEVILHPISSETVAVKGVLLFCQDVSDRVERERLQLAQIDVLRKIDAVKDQFLSIVSHELRTPLHAILGFAGILEDELAGPLNAEQHADVSKLIKEGERLVALVNDLLDLSRIRAGKLTLDCVQEDFAPLVADVVDNLSQLAKQKQLTLCSHVDAPLLAHFDMMRMAQVLNNLIGNAIKYTPEGGWIDVRSATKDGEIVVEVEDTGIGIASDDLPKLFERFSQLDMSPTRKAGGTGLGLSIAKALVEAHGGKISATSSGLGKGSTFCFSFPIGHLETLV